MNTNQSLSELVLEKLREQVERADHLIGLVPPDKIDWRPELSGDSMTMGVLLGHLLDCLAGFCAVLYLLHADRLPQLRRLAGLPVNHRCLPIEAQERMREYLGHIDDGFALMTDADLGDCLPTVFMKKGEPVLTLLMGNLEHFINHKYQLFFYLKLLGAPVATADLYHLRGI